MVEGCCENGKGLAEKRLGVGDELNIDDVAGLNRSDTPSESLGTVVARDQKLQVIVGSGVEEGISSGDENVRTAHDISGDDVRGVATKGYHRTVGGYGGSDGRGVRNGFGDGVADALNRPGQPVPHQDRACELAESVLSEREKSRSEGFEGEETAISAELGPESDPLNGTATRHASRRSQSEIPKKDRTVWNAVWLWATREWLFIVVGDVPTIARNAGPT